MFSTIISGAAVAGILSFWAVRTVQSIGERPCKAVIKWRDGIAKGTIVPHRRTVEIISIVSAYSVPEFAIGDEIVLRAERGKAQRVEVTGFSESKIIAKRI